MTPEGKTKKAVKELLGKYKIYPASKVAAFSKDAQGWYHMPVKSAFGVNGIPDFVGHYKGLFFSIETKAEGKEPTGLQAQQISAITVSGGACAVINDRPSIDAFELWLRHVDNYVSKRTA